MSPRNPNMSLTEGGGHGVPHVADVELAALAISGEEAQSVPRVLVQSPVAEVVVVFHYHLLRNRPV